MKDHVRGRLARLRTACSVFGVILGLAAGARADFYAYSYQKTSGYTFSGATVGAITPLSSTSDALIGTPSGSEAHTGSVDALQSYTGPTGTRPAENTFTPLGQVHPDYARGDSLLVLSPTVLTTQNVAESYINSAGNSAGAGAWSLSAQITVGSASALTLSFSYTNQLTLNNNPAGGLVGTVSADYGYTFTIQDASGNTVFTSSPKEVNRAVSLSMAGMVNRPDTGTITITSGTLAAGTYTGTLTGTNNVHTLVRAVPEPASLALLATGFGLFALRKPRKHVSST